MNDLTPLTDGLWGLDGSLRMGPAIHFPVRATLVRRADGSLLLYSPLEMSESTVQQIKSLGNVSAIVAPNLYHHLYLQAARESFPEATVYAPPGLEKKVQGMGSYKALDSDQPLEIEADFDRVFVRGCPKMSEALLVHRASRSLLVADYFFNIRQTKGWLTPLVLKIVSGGSGRPQQSNLWRTLAKDKDAMKSSAEKLLDQDFSRIVPCHGGLIDDGRAVAESELRWLTQR